MELYLKLYIHMIDIDKSGLSGVHFETPEELLYRYSESIFIANEPERLCYHINNCQSVFSYLDKLESRNPKECHVASWEWGGVRRNNTYYIEIHGQGLVGTDINLLNTILEVFHDGLSASEDFDLPDIERGGTDIDEYEWSEKEYDDDSDLRIVEECTAGKKWVQWYRPYPETEGFSGNTLIDLASLVLSTIPVIVLIKDRIRIKLQKAYYSCKITRLRRIVMKKTHHEGHIRSPKPMPPKYINAKTGKKEYLFYQITDEDRERKIFISVDGKDVRIV